MSGEKLGFALFGVAGLALMVAGTCGGLAQVIGWPCALVLTGTIMVAMANSWLKP